MTDSRVADIAKAMREWKTDGSADNFREMVATHFPDATPDEIRQALRTETRLMPLADRVRELELVLACLIEERSGGDPNAVLGEMISADEFAMLVGNFHLVATADGEFRDALQG
jgi:hypothetical protein